MNRPGHPTLRDLELISLGMALARTDCRDWIAASLSRDDFADDVTRRLYESVVGGRADLARLFGWWGEPTRKGEPAYDSIKRLLLRRAIEAAPGDAADSVRWMTRGKNVTPAMALAAIEEQRERLQKLADAEQALRPKAKEEAKAS